MTEHITPEEYRKKKKKKKFNNTKVVTHDGQKFDSKQEYGDNDPLLWLAGFGGFSDLKRQVTFDFVVGGILVCSYRADFTFRDEQGRSCVFETKGSETPEYRIKRKLFAALFPEWKFYQNWKDTTDDFKRR